MTQQHSSFGGSVAARIINCPGSLGLAEQCPPGPDSVYAREGTLLHKAMDALLSDEQLEPRDIIGFQVEDLEITEELYSNKLKPVWNALMGYLQERAERITDEMSEIKVELDNVPNAYGYVDYLCYAPALKTLTVVDFKFGTGVKVEVEGNAQLRFYALGAVQSLDFQAGREPSTINLVILQPDHDGHCVPAIDTITIGELMTFEQTLIAAEKLARGDEPPFHAGSHCRWCPAKAICPVLTGLSETRPEPAGLAADALGEMVTRAALLEQWIKAVRAEAHQRLEQGHPIAGWKLVAKRAVRGWLDPKAAEKWCRARFTVDETYNRVLKSPPQMEKVVKASGRKVRGLPELIGSKSSGTTLAPVDDKRAPVVGFNLGQLKLTG